MRNEMVCAKTLYNYLHKGILGIKAIDLPLVVRRSQRKSISRKHKRELGKSIELRDPNIETREEFGHWELDTVRGTKDKTDHVLISLLERKSRLYVALRCPSARATDVKETLHAWLNTFKDVNLACLCKTITADNGLGFSEISDLENETLSIYFARPYSTWDQPYVGTGFKGWLATANYALQNNVGLTAYYGFDWKSQDGAKEDDLYRVDLNYQF